MARPSSYDETKHVAAALLSAVDGATWEAIARRCERGVSTVKEWASKSEEKPGFPAFIEAVDAARKAANDKTVSSLFANANGQTTTTTTKSRTLERVLPPKNAKERERIQAEGLIDAEGLMLVYKETETTVETQHKGETGAQVFWLCNRTDEWQHVQKIEGTGAGGSVIVRIIDDVPAEA